MRSVVGLASLVYGALVVAAVAYQIHERWLDIWFYSPGFLLYARGLAVGLLAVAAITMVLGGCALAIGKPWSMLLVNRAATATALALLCYCALTAYQVIADDDKIPATSVLMDYWLPGLALVAMPVALVWWTERHRKSPIEQLSFKWRREQRRGLQMSGHCHQCGALLNFATGGGVKTPSDRPFELQCDHCGCDLNLHDAR